MEHFIEAVLYIFAFLLTFVLGVISHFTWLCDRQIKKHIRQYHREQVKDDAPAQDAV